MVSGAWLFSYLDERMVGFGVREGITLVDYGCGPDRYTVRFSKLVGEAGKVYAVNMQALALQHVKQMMGSLESKPRPFALFPQMRETGYYQ